MQLHLEISPKPERNELNILKKFGKVTKSLSRDILVSSQMPLHNLHYAIHEDNTSIENQKAIIYDYVCKQFTDSKLDFYDGRDRSNYTFEQLEGYQQMRRGLINGKYNIRFIILTGK